MEVLCLSEASRKIRHDLEEVAPRVCHVPLSLEVGDAMLANKAMKDSRERRNKLKT